MISFACFAALREAQGFLARFAAWRDSWWWLALIDDAQSKNGGKNDDDRHDVKKVECTSHGVPHIDMVSIPIDQVDLLGPFVRFDSKQILCRFGG